MAEGDQGLVQGTGGQAPLTYGQKIVGLEFNPSGDPNITKTKQLFAEAIDLMLGASGEVSADKAEIMKNAIHDTLVAQMMIVKALTFKF